jgi:hypothetical protein
VAARVGDGAVTTARAGLGFGTGRVAAPEGEAGAVGFAYVLSTAGVAVLAAAAAGEAGAAAVGPAEEPPQPATSSAPLAASSRCVPFMAAPSDVSQGRQGGIEWAIGRWS